MGGGISGQATDIQIEAAEMVYHKNSLAQILAEHTGKTLEQILKDGERNAYFSAKEAMEYGFVDRVVEKTNKQTGKSYFDEK